MQWSILGQVTKELKDIEIETPTTLERILSKKQIGVSDLDVGNQIVTYLQNTSSRLNEVTSRGYNQLQISDRDNHKREQALKYWNKVCKKVLQPLKVTMENYFEQKLNSMEGSIVQQITDGSSNCRMEVSV